MSFPGLGCYIDKKSYRNSRRSEDGIWCKYGLREQLVGHEEF